VREYHAHFEQLGQRLAALTATRGFGILSQLCDVLWRLTTRTVVGNQHHRAADPGRQSRNRPSPHGFSSSRADVDALIEQLRPQVEAASPATRASHAGGMSGRVDLREAKRFVLARALAEQCLAAITEPRPEGALSCSLPLTAVTEDHGSTVRFRARRHPAADRAHDAAWPPRDRSTARPSLN